MALRRCSWGRWARESRSTRGAAGSDPFSMKSRPWPGRPGGSSTDTRGRWPSNAIGREPTCGGTPRSPRRRDPGPGRHQMVGAIECEGCHPREAESDRRQSLVTPVSGRSERAPAQSLPLRPSEPRPLPRAGAPGVVAMSIARSIASSRSRRVDFARSSVSAAAPRDAEYPRPAIAPSPIFDKFRGLTKRSRARDPVLPRNRCARCSPLGARHDRVAAGRGPGRKRGTRSSFWVPPTGKRRSVRFSFFWGPIEGSRSLATRCTATSRRSCAH
jgi:hypothetical protein